ncbi:hypothetical protein C8Q75DRAFT_447029 [Abortiporus biennis]|nr:hypothetical protein C8Q75DRAFT_447029 [Abortiporus biennis]
MATISSFEDRVGNHQFRVASPLWGYLPQVHEWSKGALEWEAERVDGVEHMPVFKAIPIYRGERLESYARTGNSKKAAKEEAAKAMALSGHCVNCLIHPKDDRADSYRFETSVNASQLVSCEALLLVRDRERSAAGEDCCSPPCLPPRLTRRLPAPIPALRRPQNKWLPFSM